MDKYNNTNFEDFSIDKLIIIMEFHPNPEIRQSAGIECVERYVAEIKICNKYTRDYYYQKVIEISQNDRLPEKVRNAAYQNIEPLKLVFVEKYITEYDHTKLKEVLKNESFPENLRITAGIRYVETYVRGDCDELIEISQNKNLPEKIRIAAGIKCVDEYVERDIGGFTVEEDDEEKDLYDKLIEISQNEKLPEKVRIAAGIKCVEGCEHYDYYDKLIKMSQDERLLEKVRNAAPKNIEQLAMKYVDKKSAEYRFY